MFKIDIRKDGYIDITKLCKIGGKKFNNWYQNKKSKIFLEKLSKILNIKESKLLDSKIDGLNENRGTWAHPRVATNIAQWISVDFDLFVSGCIEEWKNTNKYNNKTYYEELNKIEETLLKDISEKKIRDKLCKEVNGKVEIKTEDGYIDIWIYGKMDRFIVHIVHRKKKKGIVKKND